jgi:hypothetical protein
MGIPAEWIAHRKALQKLAAAVTAGTRPASDLSAQLLSRIGYWSTHVGASGPSYKDRKVRGERLQWIKDQSAKFSAVAPLSRPPIPSFTTTLAASHPASNGPPDWPQAVLLGGAALVAWLATRR